MNLEFDSTRRGFSLLETILAVAIFATVITVVLALLPALARQGAASADTRIATGLPDALHAELRRLSEGGFDEFALAVPVLAEPRPEGFAFVATRNGARLHVRDRAVAADVAIATGEQYFLVETWRFADEPLRFDSTRAFLALQVRVSWPYQLPGVTDPTATAARQTVEFTASLNR